MSHWLRAVFWKQLVFTLNFQGNLLSQPGKLFSFIAVPIPSVKSKPQLPGSWNCISSSSRVVVNPSKKVSSESQEPQTTLKEAFWAIIGNPTLSACHVKSHFGFLKWVFRHRRQQIVLEEPENHFCIHFLRGITGQVQKVNRINDNNIYSIAFKGKGALP